MKMLVVVNFLMELLFLIMDLIMVHQMLIYIGIVDFNIFQVHGTIKIMFPFTIYLFCFISYSCIVVNVMQHGENYYLVLH